MVCSCTQLWSFCKSHSSDPSPNVSRQCECLEACRCWDASSPQKPAQVALNLHHQQWCLPPPDAVGSTPASSRSPSSSLELTQLMICQPIITAFCPAMIRMENGPPISRRQTIQTTRVHSLAPRLQSPQHCSRFGPCKLCQSY